MNLWNRIAISLVATLVLVGAVVTLLAAGEVLKPDFLPGGTAETGSWFYAELEGLANYGGNAVAITVIVTAVMAIAMLGVIFLEIRPFLIRGQPTLQISSTQEGSLTVEVSSVRLLAERTGLSNRNISGLRCRLGVARRATPGGPASIVIACYPRLVLGSTILEVRDDLQTRIKDAVEMLTGLTVVRVNVERVRYDRGDSSRLLDASRPW